MNISQSNTEKHKTVLLVNLGVGYKAAGSVDANRLAISVPIAPLNKPACCHTLVVILWGVCLNHSQRG